LTTWLRGFYKHKLRPVFCLNPHAVRYGCVPSNHLIDKFGLKASIDGMLSCAPG
jgi:hypothetical protein